MVQMALQLNGTRLLDRLVKIGRQDQAQHGGCPRSRVLFRLFLGSHLVQLDSAALPELAHQV
jgi:hypothetical protein